jgi:hypothetical protein
MNLLFCCLLNFAKEIISHRLTFRGYSAWHLWGQESLFPRALGEFAQVCGRLGECVVLHRRVRIGRRSDCMLRGNRNVVWAKKGFLNFFIDFNFILFFFQLNCISSQPRFLHFAHSQEKNHVLREYGPSFRAYTTSATLLGHCLSIGMDGYCGAASSFLPKVYCMMARCFCWCCFWRFSYCYCSSWSCSCCCCYWCHYVSLYLFKTYFVFYFYVIVWDSVITL